MLTMGNEKPFQYEIGEVYVIDKSVSRISCSRLRCLSTRATASEYVVAKYVYRMHPRLNIQLLVLKKVFSPNLALLTHAPENPPLLPKPQRGIQLGDTPLVHDANAIVADDSL